MYYCIIVIDNEKVWFNQFCVLFYVGIVSWLLFIFFEFFYFDIFLYWVMLVVYGVIIGMSLQVNGFFMDYWVGQFFK